MFVETVYDMVGLYLSPLKAAVVPFVDERSQTQALVHSLSAFAMIPGVPAKRTMRLPPAPPRHHQPGHRVQTRRIAR